MRELQRVAIDLHTGDVALTSEIIEEDAGFAERFRQLKETVPEATPESVRTASVRCDGCDDVVEVDFDKPELPPGWTATAEGDFCPRCGTAN